MNIGTLAGQTVHIVGKLTNKRALGNVIVYKMTNDYGEIKVYARKKDMGKHEYFDFKALPNGSIVEVRGSIFYTLSHELSIKAKCFTLTSPSKE